ncbi:sensor histidine kinase [Staphylococcus canis]|uniref:histidine kinase n=1 Tax=Staphylococcus canis TaxID=2724942 RepID=A0ABS0T9M1_9STAP|nr:HAMP domain-containing sensor histidine kinase [Staphylococcus canis]MBI5974464.1 HAMP domain-containing histidine kinase [Staphylococcus canis]
MKPYKFGPVFLKYLSILAMSLALIFLSVLILFSYKLNHEIDEMASRELRNTQQTMAQGGTVDQSANYFIVRGETIVVVHSPFSKATIQKHFLNSKHTPFIKAVDNGVYDVRKASLSNQRTLYYLTDIRDLHETKSFLVSVIVVAFVLTFVLLTIAIYDMVRKPIRTYEALMAEQTHFIQNASHEMKTPIASILLGLQYIEMLDAKQLSEAGQHTLKQMKNETMYMQQLIESMLDQEGNVENIEPVNISVLLDGVIDTIERTYHKQIRRLYAPDLTHPIVPLHFKQMINILLENAIKHNDETVMITVSASNTVNGIEIKVSDNGAGIKKRDQQRIFQRFYRANTKTKGSGIGLSILYAHIQRYHGTVEVKSKEGVGTTFLIKL